MRSLTTAVTAAAGALVLLLAVPGAAFGATGQFRYTFRTAEGYEAGGFLNSPPSLTCVNLPGAHTDALPPAYAPKNRTDVTATVFLRADCEGDTYYTLNPGAGASDRLLVRSVLFS
ncbi:hypothetical protein AB0H29_00200 [Streptomyces thermolilacinus]